MIRAPNPANANHSKGVERKAVLPSRLKKRLLEGIRSSELEEFLLVTCPRKCWCITLGAWALEQST